MKVAKSSITRLRNNINDTLPDGDDIYQFKGVNKKLISDALQETYNLLMLMENDRASFDIICLKRSIADLTDRCNSILRVGFEYNKGDNFNKLLNCIFDIRKTVKEAYLLFVDDCILTSSQVGALKDNLSSLSLVLEEFTEIKEHLNEDKIYIDSITDDMDKFYKKFEDVNPVVDNAQSRIKELLDEVQFAHGKVLESEGVIAETKSSITRNKIIYTEAKKRLDLQIEVLSKKISDSDKIIDKLNKSQHVANEQKEYIQQIIDDAHRASMAGSFRTRKEELDEPILLSGRIMNWSLIAIGIISAILLFTSGFTNDQFDWQGFITKLPIIAPLIWIAWANNKKHNYLMRIREDYAFKYASAMAFEGYKKQVQETDPELEQRLLHLSIENMGQNPIRLFDKKIHSTPINEMLTNITETIQAIKNRDVSSSRKSDN